MSSTLGSKALTIMKNLLLSSVLLITLTITASCRKSVTPTPDPDPVLKMPFFNQVNTEFRGSQANRLLQFWYSRRSAEPVEFAAINDQKNYQAFFGQTSADSLPYIDFNRYTLLIGNRSGYGSFVDGPANIKGIEQDLQLQPGGDWQYTVTVRARSKGSEWFGFAALAPRIDQPQTVKLKMQYQYN